MEFQLYNVGPRIPQELAFLETLSNNIWWCWHPSAIELFVRINPNLWREVNGNAKTFLRSISQERLEELARDRSFLKKMKLVAEEFNRQVPEENVEKRSIAYFSLEFGIHESIPIFSGGLGVLAGDHLKAASDMELPLVAVGLLYRQGYFRQVLDRNGWQIEHYPVSEIHDLPISRAHDKAGNEVTIRIRLVNRDLYAAVWVLPVGNVPLVLLDTEIPQNDPDLREVSWRLYGGDKRMRLHQELLLGIGGFKALIAMGYEPSVCHMNEGHAGFLSLARIAHLVNDQGYEPGVALEAVWRSNIFTTHTPVPAGNEVFDIGLVRPYLEVFAQEAHLDVDRVIRWGIPIGNRENATEMSMTVLGLRLANYSNGVSALHGEVARDMWKNLWPQRSVSEVPIKHITNGVHCASWVSSRLFSLFDRYLPANWATNPNKKTLAESVHAIPDDELWMVHELSRQSLVRRSRKLLKGNYRYVGNPSAQKQNVLDPDILTIGFARRFATYKRGTLLLRNAERLITLLKDTNRPIQFIFAGKAHPADDGGKRLIQELIHFAEREGVLDRLLFLENYDIGMARTLVQGVDVWLNTPRRPQEASGTSGMKAAVNGVVNCSILDGWWAEGYNGKNGWAIEGNDYYTEDEDRDNYESQALFNLLENEIIPCFYERQGHDLPLRWINYMKESIITGLGEFSSTRMVDDYENMFYRPAREAYAVLTKDNAAFARTLRDEKQRLEANFYGSKLYVEQPVENRPLTELHVGDTFKVTTKVNLGDLTPAEVDVEAYYGTVNAHNEIVESSSSKLEMVKDLGYGNYEYSGNVTCTFAGRFGLTARIKASGIEWDNSIPGFICWPK